MENRKIQLVTILFVLVFISQIFSETVGNVSYIGQPENLNNQTIDLPHGIVALSEHVSVGIPGNLSNDVGSAIPSIMFVLDNSGSMWVEKYGAKDANANRYKVTMRLIDSLFARNPEAEVGVSVFGTERYFDTNDDKLFKAPNDEGRGGYIPLLTLNKTYDSDNAGNVTGREVIQHYLKLRSTPRNDNPLRYEGYGKSGTNITAGFDGATSAFSHTTNPAKRQYVIFISDGDATAPGNAFDTEKDTPEEKAERERFKAGTNVPTTFTIFFADSTGKVPESIATMTGNIQGNQYSENNGKSAYHAYKNTTEDDLMDFLMTNVISLIDQKTNSEVTNVKINGGTGVNGWNGTTVSFGEMFPLTGDVTPFQFDISYLIEDTITDESTGAVEIKILDTTLTTNYDVKLSDGAPNPVPDSLNAKYWSRSIGFFSGTEPLTSVTGNCEIQFVEEAIDIFYGYSDVAVTITSETKGDSETYQLNKSGTNTFVQSVMFNHQDAAAANDGVLQAHSEDVLIARFQNPKLPLDTLEIRVPYDAGTLLTINNATYFDNSGDGFIDSIFVGFATNKSVPDSDVEQLFSLMNFPSERYFTFGNKSWNNGLALNVTEDNPTRTPRTSIQPFDKISLRAANLATGGVTYESEAIVVDSVAPVILADGAFLSDETGTENDRLTVLFSEPLKEGTVSGSYFDFFRGTDEYTVQLTPESFVDNSVIYTVGFISSGYDNMIDGDSLRINGGASLIEDGAGVVQTRDVNPKRVLRVQSSISITSSAMHDVNADGLIDSITIAISAGEGAEINIDDLLPKISLPAHRGLTIDTAWVSESVVTLMCTQINGDINTAVTDQDAIKIMAGSVGSVMIPANVSTIPVDKMSPVIMPSGAFLVDLPNGGVDTVTVIFSEAIVEKNSAGQPFTFRRGTDQYGVFLTFVEMNGAEVKYEVNSVASGKSVKSGDSLRISGLGLVEDGAGNLQNNPLNVEREVMVVSTVEFSNASYWDMSGDGLIDSITIEVGVGDGIELNSESLLGLITLPADRNFSVLSSSIAGNILTLNVKEGNSVPNTAVSASDVIVITAGKFGGVQVLSTKTISVVDRVAPVILEDGATLFDYSDGVPDTLVIKFSENLGALESSGEQFSFRRGDTPYKLFLSVTSQSGNAITFSVDHISGVDYALSGDSLRINSLTSQIKDIPGTRQLNALNIERELNVISKVSPVSATYYDDDANGMIDRVEIAVEASNAFFQNETTEFLSLITLPADRVLTIDSSYFALGTLTLIVTEGAKAPNTAVSSTDIVTIAAGTASGGTVMNEVSLDVIDAMAPVIMPNGAIYHDSLSGTDFIEIVFSEPVTVADASAETINFSDGAVPYQMIIKKQSENGNSYTFSIEEGMRPETSETDSVHINSVITNIVQDLNGLVQESADNVRRALQVQAYVNPYELQVNAISPYIQGVSVIPDGLDHPSFELRPGVNGGYTGMVMQARAVVAGSDQILEGLQLEGRIRILDQVGNVILDSGELVYMPENGTMIFVWNGLNEIAREVASGAYLAQFSVRATVASGGYDQELIKNIMVGVKKPVQ